MHSLMKSVKTHTKWNEIVKTIHVKKVELRKQNHQRKHQTELNLDVKELGSQTKTSEVCLPNKVGDIKE